MRLGVDGRKIPEAAKRGPIGSLEHAGALGLDGLFFRTVLDVSQRLDGGELAEIRAAADGLGLYLEMGLGKVNPYAMPEAPELRAAGDGDTVLGFRRMMEACAAIGCRELWVATANYKGAYVGRWCYDRFRTDVSWAEQLAATERFLKILAPIARDLGIHMNIETHEEITSFELVRLVESVGPDVTGIVFDTANVLQRGEHPTWCARRIAPYVRQTHVKDGYLGHAHGGLDFQMRPCGEGIVDFAAILPILAAANPALNLTIENTQSQDDKPDSNAVIHIEIFDPDWLAGHPDLTVEEYAAFHAMVLDYQRRVAAESIDGIAAYAARPFGYAEAVASIEAGARHIRAVCDAAGLPLAERTR
ncbi:sugar phosphate isomerase/epimerase [Mesorhizobium sp. BR1-1-16]|uniref:sugar phosphate isomerase/epimerase family protein n=1 Tax=Mesorhizobium sp. BR1-1-16 TaxID=2876653 RepID=UPI001CCB602F|nr:sugar phosphate isomerase/epimerase family protein [Mesorhizobium sp. BR1-1-16]MBZ9939414.1 sugar phosphate isomerase/epimerase [Mesorhizobium sp. BR1-1-16]